VNLTWHIVKKDLRRMAGPVALWCAFILAGACWFRSAELKIVGNAEAAISEWISLLGIWGNLIFVGQWVFLAVLAAALVLEDAVVGTSAFWMTRPIAGTRLLLAKTIAAIVLFVVLPGLALIPVWLSISSEVRALAWALLWTCGGFALASLFAFTVATLTRTLGQFLFAVVAFFFAVCAVTYVAIITRHGSADFRLDLAVPVFAWVAIQQYVTRNAPRGWCILAAGWLVTVAVAWLGVPHLRLPGDRPLPPPPDEVAETVHVDHSFARFSRRENEAPNLFVTTAASRGTFYAPGDVRAADGTILLWPDQDWGDGAAVAAVESQGRKSRFTWQLRTLRLPGESDPQASGTLRLWSVHAQIMGTVTLREGAELADSWGRIRIVALRQDGGRLTSAWVERRDVSSGPSREAIGPLGGLTSGATLILGRYVLLDSVTQVVQPLAAHSRTEFVLNGQRVAFTRLSGNAPFSPTSTLVIVRLVCEPRYELPIEVKGIEVRGTPEQP
jgi:hypothetical protein